MSVAGTMELAYALLAVLPLWQSNTTPALSRSLSVPPFVPRTSLVPTLASCPPDSVPWATLYAALLVWLACGAVWW
ncbi:uncharacterized protein J3D65DRAFT_672323 [Phyllosticta citribraziliensis]|uniref:Secreted protein n=1 Tax=Phyllosticta citribraziliensis TaxID=989973 RepID=A0ABR1L3W9_9PEZI